ncbi:MAG TPA: glycosyltransferase family 39 protein [Thermoanaerobaculia bacterium]|nr:glycosyltransferase family 39 protein [Thermoanaerobaculia bacterium]
MPAVQSRVRQSLFAAAVFLTILAIVLVQRVPLYRHPGVLLGWNSDSAIHGLMARAMVRERRPLFLFWGQDYLGTLSAFSTLLASVFAGGVSPLALRIGAALQFALALTFGWFALRRIWGVAVATIAMLWLASGPRYFFEQGHTPLSSEPMLLFGLLVLWYATRVTFDRARDWFGLGVLAGLGWWAHRGSSFAVVAVIVAAVWFLRARFDGRFAASFAAGVPLGLVPQFIGMRQIDQYLYTPVTAEFSLLRVWPRLVETITVDLWQFAGDDSRLMAILLLALFALGCARLRWRREDVTAVTVLLITLAFWLFSPQAYSGATRYLALALPLFFAIGALGVTLLWERTRIAAMLVVAVIAGSFYTCRALDVRAIAAGARERYERWPGGFDPRPALAAIDAGGYRACYADFWLAYKLEWLSSSGVEFIPYRSVNRTQVRSLRLASEPGRKCFVALDGRVRTLTPREEAFFRQQTVAAIDRWRRGAAPVR